MDPEAQSLGMGMDAGGFVGWNDPEGVPLGMFPNGGFFGWDDPEAQAQGMGMNGAGMLGWDDSDNFGLGIQ